jgi:hypothetical protein
MFVFLAVQLMELQTHADADMMHYKLSTRGLCQEARPLTNIELYCFAAKFFSLIIMTGAECQQQHNKN